MKKFSVRLLSVLLALTMLVTLAACGKEPAADNKTDGTTTTTVTTEATTASTTLDTTTTTADAETTTAGDTTTTATEEQTTAPATTTDNIFRPGPGPGDKPTAPTTTTTAPSTTKQPVTGFIPSVPTTTTTTKVTTTTAGTTTTVATTTTTVTPVPKKSIRILAVGNSFSVDAMQNHLFQVLTSLGYNDIILGNLYVSGCSIDTHWANVSGNKKAYYYYQCKPETGVWGTYYNVLADKAFEKVEWDVITVQQASPDSGRSGTFGNLAKLVGWLKEKSPDAKILYHMTWAYQADSTHWAFPAYYGSDQAKMYNDIVTATRDTAAKTAGVQGVIPVGTAIQNLRTSSLGDTVTSDGHHLLDTYGDYTAAVTWACYITGESANKVTYRPDTVADHFNEIAQSVTNALANPYAITACN